MGALSYGRKAEDLIETISEEEMKEISRFHKSLIEKLKVKLINFIARMLLLL